MAVEVLVVVEGLDDVEVGLDAVIEQLEIDAPLAVKVVIEGFEDFDQSKVVELLVMLCDDARIRKLNKEWRGKDSATDVLSFPQDQPTGAPLMHRRRPLPYLDSEGGACRARGVMHITSIVTFFSDFL